MDRYEEAMSRCKQWEREHTSGYVIQDMIEFIFPELRESEDERIRKTLVQLVEDAWAGRETAEVSDEKVYHACLAYLEKQKEPLTPEEKMNHPLYLEGFDVGKRVGETLKEQKPAEWSEEDEKTLDCIINVLDRLGFEEYCKSSRDQDVEEERFYYKEIQCLKKLKSLRPQQKKELNFSGFVDKIGSWFANLTLDRYRETFDGDVYPATLLVQKYDSFVNKLSEEYNEKALHWKPSEEQMKALLRAVDELQGKPYWGYINEVVYDIRDKLM